jgi:hypothetical protein
MGSLETISAPLERRTPCPLLLLVTLSYFPMFTPPVLFWCSCDHLWNKWLAPKSTPQGLLPGKTQSMIQNKSHWQKKRQEGVDRKTHPSSSFPSDRFRQMTPAQISMCCWLNIINSRFRPQESLTEKVHWYICRILWAASDSKMGTY